MYKFKEVKGQIHWQVYDHFRWRKPNGGMYFLLKMYYPLLIRGFMFWGSELQGSSYYILKWKHSVQPRFIGNYQLDYVGKQKMNNK